MNKPGCLRKILIGIILSVSISSALVYFTFTRGMYKGEAAEYTSLVVENGWIFTGLAEVPKVQRLIIRNSSIACIGSDCEVPENARVLNAQGMTLLPALTDLGIQFYRASGEDRNLSSFKQFLSFTRQRPEVRKNMHLAGISTIRSVGDAPQNILVLRDQLADGKLAGPRLYAAGFMVSAPQGYPQASAYEGNAFMQENGVFLIEGPNSIASCVEKLEEEEVDGVKIVYRSFDGKFPIMEYGELEALISKAKELNIWISVLTGNNQELQEALTAGAEIIEFGTNELIDTSNINLLLEKQALYLPMLSSLETDTTLRRIQLYNVSRIHQAGARIGAASDNLPFQRHGKSLQRELELLTEAGISAEEVLKIATLEAAISLQTDDRFGSLEVGKWADVLITQGKAWENIQDIKQVKYLIQEGNIVVENGKVLE